MYKCSVSIGGLEGPGDGLFNLFRRPSVLSIGKVTFAACAKFKEDGQEEREKATVLERSL